MKKSSKIGGKGTAKRKILLRQFMETTFIKEKKLSDPFEEDENEEFDDSDWDIKPLKINKKKNHKLFEEEKQEDEESPPDDILVKNRDLCEADKFIASLKLPSKRPAVKKENLLSSFYNNINFDFKESFEKFKEESERLNSILNDDENSEFDDYII